MATPNEVIEIIGEEDYEIVFVRGEKDKYSDNEKLRLAKLVLKYKEEHEAAKRYSNVKKKGYIVYIAIIKALLHQLIELRNIRPPVY